MSSYLLQQASKKLEAEKIYNYLKKLSIDNLNLFQVVDALKKLDRLTTLRNLLIEEYPDIEEFISILELELIKKQKELEKNIDVQACYFDDIV